MSLVWRGPLSGVERRTPPALDASTLLLGYRGVYAKKKYCSVRYFCFVFYFHLLTPTLNFVLLAVHENKLRHLYLYFQLIKNILYLKQIVTDANQASLWSSIFPAPKNKVLRRIRSTRFLKSRLHILPVRVLNSL